MCHAPDLHPPATEVCQRNALDIVLQPSNSATPVSLLPRENATSRFWDQLVAGNANCEQPTDSTSSSSIKTHLTLSCCKVATPTHPVLLIAPRLATWSSTPWTAPLWRRSSNWQRRRPWCCPYGRMSQTADTGRHQRNRCNGDETTYLQLCRSHRRMSTKQSVNLVDRKIIHAVE